MKFCSKCKSVMVDAGMYDPDGVREGSPREEIPGSGKLLRVEGRGAREAFGGRQVEVCSREGEGDAMIQFKDILPETYSVMPETIRLYYERLIRDNPAIDRVNRTQLVTILKYAAYEKNLGGDNLPVTVSQTLYSAALILEQHQKAEIDDVMARWAERFSLPR